MGFREKVVSGILWSFGQQFGAKIVSLLISIVLARILAPAEFGQLAMIYVFISIGSSLMDSGLTSSLIRTNDADQKDYSTVFFFNLAGSLVVYAILFVAAPWLAIFYKEPALTNIIRVIGVTFIINAFFGVQNARFIKEMNFKVPTMIQIPSVLGGGILGIVLAKSGYGVWSLVWMSICSSTLLAVMNWIFSGWRPSFAFDRERFKKHFHFGYKMTLSGLLDTFYQNIYVIIIGKYYSATQLGYYSRADSMSQFPINNISVAMSKVTYPMFASISDDNIKLKVIYQRVLKQVVFWNAPILIFLCIIADPLFRMLLTEKWLPAVPYFRILCIAGIMYPLHSYNLNILKVKGRSDLFLKLEVIKKLTCVVGIMSVIPFGIYGLLYFQLGYSFFGYYVNTIYSGKIIDYSIVEQIQDLLPSVCLSVIVGGVCYFIDSFLIRHFNVTDLERIIFTGFFYSLFYFISASLFKLTAVSDFKQLILKR
ncbi:MAG: lipopolysaccharide biosynthesis protein [Arcticibacter sp.]